MDLSEFPVSNAGAPRYTYRDGELRQRANLDCLTEAEVDALREAFRQIYDLNGYAEDRRSYNNQALIHQNHCQHGWERFLPWHRAYLYEFEQNLQDFVKDITVPYWDWTMPQYRPHEPEKGWIIPKAFQAFLREKPAEELIAALRPNPTPTQEKAFRALVEPRKYFVSQHAFFCYVINTIGYTEITPDPNDANRQAMIYALLMSNSLWYPLRYPAEYEGGQIISTNCASCLGFVNQLWRLPNGPTGSPGFRRRHQSVDDKSRVRKPFCDGAVNPRAKHDPDDEFRRLESVGISRGPCECVRHLRAALCDVLHRLPAVGQVPRRAMAAGSPGGSGSGCCGAGHR
jgi:hypothetical protein